MTPIDTIIALLEKKGIRLESGLNNGEIQKIETRFQFRFPPDLCLLLQTVLPVSEGFYHWRMALVDINTAEQIEKMFDWVYEGICFDVEHNNFWVSRDLPDVPSWGPKPETLEKQLDTAKVHIATYPKLLPIYRHRFIPETPHEEGNPVFSVYQTDIIHYGDCLVDYFGRELIGGDELPHEVRRIPFWSDCCDGLYDE